VEVKDFGRKGAKGMKKKVFSDEKKVEVLREAEQSGKSIQEVCRTHGISEPTFYLLRKKFGSLKENDVKRLRDLEKENLRLKRLLAERDVELDVVREFLQKSKQSSGEAKSGRVPDQSQDFPEEGLGNVTSGIGLWKRHDMLEKTERLANSWRVAKGLKRTIEQTGFGGSNRLVQGGGRQ
jgi:putative transposase